MSAGRLPCLSSESNLHREARQAGPGHCPFPRTRLLTRSVFQAGGVLGPWATALSHRGQRAHSGWAAGARPGSRDNLQLLPGTMLRPRPVQEGGLLPHRRAGAGPAAHSRHSPPLPANVPPQNLPTGRAHLIPMFQPPAHSGLTPPSAQDQAETLHQQDNQQPAGAVADPRQDPEWSPQSAAPARRHRRPTVTSSREAAPTAGSQLRTSHRSAWARTQTPRLSLLT